jgi:hypothetical protein
MNWLKILWKSEVYPRRRSDAYAFYNGIINLPNLIHQTTKPRSSQLDQSIDKSTETWMCWFCVRAVRRSASLWQLASLRQRGELYLFGSVENCVSSAGGSIASLRQRGSPGPRNADLYMENTQLELATSRCLSRKEICQSWSICSIRTV